MFAGTGALQSQIHVQMVGHAQDDEVQVRSGDHAANIGRCVHNMPLLGEPPGVIAVCRCDHRYLPTRHVAETQHVKIADKTTAQQADSNRHGAVLRQSESSKAVIDLATPISADRFP